MSRCVLYCRVSTTQQAAEGISVEAQEARLKAWATALGYDVLSCQIDAGISGKRADNRPALQEALRQACENKAALVVYSLSRLARSTKDAIAIAERLDKAGADLVSLSESIDTTSAAGKMVFRLLAVLAEFERDLVSERTKLALAYKKGRGEKTGGTVPYGYRVMEGKLVAEAHEQEAIRLGMELARQGHSFRSIARQLHAKGYTQRLMTNKTIAAILRRHGLNAA